MFGVNGAEFLVLVVVALLVVGPERLPAYAEQLATWVRSLRRFMSTARERVADELGAEAADVDWASLDPRRYDPRRIVREALLEDLEPGRATSTRSWTAPGASSARRVPGPLPGPAAAAAAVGGPAAASPLLGPPPFDDEAT